MKQKKKKLNRTSQDSLWKELIEEFFPQLMEFLFPDIYQEIDFTKKYEWLDKEFQKIVKDSKVGKRLADKLVKVHLKDGTERWICIHIEVQGKKEKGFNERVFIYNYRIFDRYHKKVISLVILTDRSKTFRPGKYEFRKGSFNLSFEFPVVKLIDYRDRMKELEESSNPFALIILAFLKLLETKSNDKKLNLKIIISKMVYEKKVDRKTGIKLLRFIDWIISLPEDLEIKYNEELKKIEGVIDVPYVTSFERIGFKKGKEKGIEKGKEEEKIKVAKKALAKGYSMDDISDLTGLPVEELKKLINEN